MSAQSSGPPPLAARIIMQLAKGVFVFLAGIAAATLITNLWWRLTPTKDLDVLVYDQTVPTDEYPEHAVLDQLLEYHRVPFDLGDDHVGAAPGGGEFGTWPTAQPDMIFLADVYGVYLDSDGEVDEYGWDRATGALTLDQANDVQRWVETGTPAYGEFSLVTDPTPADAAQVLEETFNFRSSGWVFSKFDDLTKVSPVIRTLGPVPWTYTGPGLIALNVDAAGRAGTRQLIVLTEDDLTALTPLVVGGAPGAIAGDAPFDSWFSWTEPTGNAVVDAWFELPVTDSGAAVLEDAGIPLRFPALIRTENTLYFGGDGLADETPFRLRRLKGGAVLTRLITGSEFRFIYTILEPAVGWLIEQSEAAADIRAAATTTE